MCPDGQAWVDERCEDCQFSIVPWLGGVVLALLAIRAGYFLANLTATWIRFVFDQLGVGEGFSCFQGLYPLQGGCFERGGSFFFKKCFQSENSLDEAILQLNTSR